MDENIIDFESRKVKERRAHEEVKSGRYRQPNFITSNHFCYYNNNQSMSMSIPTHTQKKNIYAFFRY